MGMENDNHTVMTYAEQQEQLRLEKERAEREAKKVDPGFRALCSFTDRNKIEKLILIDKNRQFFTLTLKRWFQIDPLRNSPLIPEWNNNPTPFTEEDRLDFFGA